MNIMKLLHILLILSILMALLHGCMVGYAQEYTDEQIVNAIYKAEGGSKATYLYGIRSVSYKDEAEARRTCLNTVRNNRRRFKDQTKHNEYLLFLASRYCPINADNDPKGLNKNWVKNVKYFLEYAD